MLKYSLKFLFVFVFISGCAQNQSKVELGDAVFQVELADTPESITMGLMYRESMPDNVGMLFVFSDEAMRSFWMKNTLIPLDIIYLDADKKVVSIQHNARPCKNTISRCPSYPSEKPAMYVLEINSGLSKKMNIKTGDAAKITFVK